MTSYFDYLSTFPDFEKAYIEYVDEKTREKIDLDVRIEIYMSIPQSERDRKILFYWEFLKTKYKGICDYWEQTIRTMPKYKEKRNEKLKQMIFKE